MGRPWHIAKPICGEIYILIPIGNAAVRAIDATPKHPQNTRRMREAIGPPGKKAATMRVLIVDDDPIQRSVARVRSSSPHPRDP